MYPPLTWIRSMRRPGVAIATSAPSKSPLNCSCLFIPANDTMQHYVIYVQGTRQNCTRCLRTTHHSAELLPAMQWHNAAQHSMSVSIAAQHCTMPAYHTMKQCFKMPAPHLTQRCSICLWETQRSTALSACEWHNAAQHSQWNYALRCLHST